MSALELFGVWFAVSIVAALFIGAAIHLGHNHPRPPDDNEDPR